MPKVSIIIPVYKAEKYLSRCVDSILKQTLSDFELILIDDGSPDNSGKICDEYAIKDKRITVIHQENQGVSAARQKGLDTAKGEYVIHADPDDWVESNWLELLYNKAISSNVDIVSCDFIREYMTGSVYQSERPTSYYRNDLIKDLLSEKIWGSTCNKLVKRNFIIENNISFDKRQNLWEDLLFVTKLVLCGASYEHIDKGLYHYDCFSNTNSIVRKSKPSQVNSQQVFLDYIIKEFGEDLDFEKYIYSRKLNVKRTAFYCGVKYNDLLINTYSDINQHIIRNNHSFHHNVKYYCIAQCLKGNPKYGHFVYGFFNNIYMPIKCWGKRLLHLSTLVFLIVLSIPVFASCDKDNDTYYEDFLDITDSISHSTPSSDNEDNDTILAIEKYMTQDWGSSNLQGGDCYGDYFFQFENYNKRVFVSNLKTKEFLGAVELVAISKNHCNNVSFSRVFYNVEDEFPLLYVSGSQTGTYNNVQVYRIQRADQSFSFTKVQEITLPKCSSENNLYWTGAVMDNKNGFMYVYANSNGAQIAKFNMPDFSQEKVVLTDTDILEQFSLPSFTHQQGAAIRNGLLFVMDGVPQWGDTNFLRIIDLVNKTDYDKINISALGFGNIEFESLSYYEDCFITASNSNRGIFTIRFLKK